MRRWEISLWRSKNELHALASLLVGMTIEGCINGGALEFQTNDISSPHRRNHSPSSSAEGA